MDTMATVVKVDGKWMGEIVRSEACAKCGACQHGRQERRYYPLPEGDWHEGDQVRISLPDQAAFSASALAYGIPLAGLLVGLAVPAALNLAEWWQALGALAGTGLGYLGLKLLEPRLRRSGKFAPKCPHAGEGKRSP